MGMFPDRGRSLPPKLYQVYVKHGNVRPWGGFGIELAKRQSPQGRYDCFLIGIVIVSPLSTHEREMLLATDHSVLDLIEIREFNKGLT